MDRNTILKSIFCAAVLALVSCSQDELFSDAGDANGEALPEGMYPLQIGSISVSAEGSGQPWGAEEPQTRVSENSDGSGSLFKANDAIGVSLGGKTATYTYNGSTWNSTKPLYWENTLSAKVAAWFPAAYTYVTLDDQTGGLAYVLKATTDNVSYNTAANLTFTHQLAKVRVELSGLRASKVTGMEIYSYTSCTHTQGTVSTSRASLGWIKMKSVTYNGTKYWEANVVPGQTITKFRINESTDGTLNGNGITPAAGAMHKISLQVNANGVSADATLITPSNCTNISGDGDYVVNGTFNSTITVTGGKPKIYLVDAMVSVTSGNAISITGNASPIIHVVGENTVENTSMTSNKGGAGIYVGSGSSVTITGNGCNDVLTAIAGADAAGIGSTTNATCGNIIIKNVTVKAYGSYYSYQYPGIGAYSNCGTINIENAKVYAYGTAQSGGSSAPAIGSYTSVPNITISGSDIYAYRGSYAGTSYADYIGRGGDAHDYQGGAIQCGTGSITNTTVYKGAYDSPTSSSSDEGSVVY